MTIATMVTITAMADITTDITIITTVSSRKLARFRGAAWVGRRC
jgi:hypothetical protein